MQNDFRKEKLASGGPTPLARRHRNPPQIRARGASSPPILMKELLISLLTLFAVTSVSADDGGFLFVGYKGVSTPMSEQIHFNLSHDGMSWEALNKAEPVLISSVGEKGVRDPFILSSPDGKKFYLLGTDLSINRQPTYTRAATAGSKSIVVWESNDLVTWSDPRLVRVAPEDAGCVWAPKAIYDEATHTYLVFWTAKNKSDNFRHFRIWAARTTDFKTFETPFVYIEQPYGITHSIIVREYGTYYRFSKNDHTGNVVIESSNELTGTWSEMTGSSLANTPGGSMAIVILRAPIGQLPTWCLLLDDGRNYRSYISTDLGSGQFTATRVTAPYRSGSGALLPLTPEEYARLKKAYP